MIMIMIIMMMIMIIVIIIIIVIMIMIGGISLRELIPSSGPKYEDARLI